ncbi:hypothetical protein QE152_g13688 [Popillia japonica]|uniref:Uncharacterized protein n=1 Tax=Popillia japonica TaxID=7064 RepID=A0AAW1LBK1_POPJA
MQACVYTTNDKPHIQSIVTVTGIQIITYSHLLYHLTRLCFMSHKRRWVHLFYIYETEFIDLNHESLTYSAIDVARS